MKRVLSILLVCALIFGCGLEVFAEKSDAVTRLTGLGILQGDEGGLRLEDNLTRSEFCALTARLLGMDNYVSGVDTVFDDVKAEHWASGYVNALYNMGLVNGNGYGGFLPDNNITYAEAVKILVCATGYGAASDGNIAYPEGYLALGSKLSITNDTVNDGLPINRLTAAKLIDNTLDVIPLEPVYGTSDYRKNENNFTFYDMLLEGRNLIEIKGVLVGNEFAGLYDSDYECEKGYITIDVTNNSSDQDFRGTYKFRSSDEYNGFLGYSVSGYIRETPGKSGYEIVSLSCDDTNHITTVLADEVELSDNYMEYYTENKSKPEKINFDSDVIYMYNNRLPEHLSSSDKIIYSGQYRLLDNDDDRRVDVVFIDEYESFIAESVNVSNKIIYFANKELYRGVGNIKYDIEDEEKVFELRDADMKPIDFEDIEVGDGISIMRSTDGVYTQIIVSKYEVSGVVEGVNSAKNTVEINGKQYKLALGTDGRAYADVSISDDAEFVLDMYGRIIDVYGEKAVKMKYGYVVAAKEKNGLESGIVLRIINGLEPQRVETVKNGNVEVSYIFQNNEMFDLNVSPKALCYETYQGVNSNEHYVQSFMEFALNADTLSGTIIGYTTNSDNEINKIYKYSIPQADSLLGNSQFNADIISFGGEAAGSTIGRGYATNYATQFICIPNHASPSNEDYFVQVEIDDESSGNYVYGVKSFFAYTSSDLNYEEEMEFQNGQPVDVLVIRAEMHADNPRAVSEDADVCIVGSVSSVIGKDGDDEGCKIYRIELLNGEEKIVEYTASSGKAFEAASGLIKGDLIQYNKDGYGKIAKIELLGHVQGLDVDLETDDPRDHNWRIEGNMIYGQVKNIERDIYYYNYNENVELLTLDFGNGQTKRIRIPVTDGPNVYLYEPRSGWIYPATADDIVAGQSSVCAYTDNNGMVSALVIIEY